MFAGSKKVSTKFMASNQKCCLVETIGRVTFLQALQRSFRTFSASNRRSSSGSPCPDQSGGDNGVAAIPAANRVSPSAIFPSADARSSPPRASPAGGEHPAPPAVFPPGKTPNPNSGHKPFAGILIARPLSTPSARRPRQEHDLIQQKHQDRPPLSTGVYCRKCMSDHSGIWRIENAAMKKPLIDCRIEAPRLSAATPGSGGRVKILPRLGLLIPARSL